MVWAKIGAQVRAWTTGSGAACRSKYTTAREGEDGTLETRSLRCRPAQRLPTHHDGNHVSQVNTHACEYYGINPYPVILF